jgi:CheY-like chemotaxis protein
LGANPCAILEVFESLGQAVKVCAASHHAVREILDCHQPDNGLVASMYEVITMEYMMSELKAIKAERRGD